MKVESGAARFARRALVKDFFNYYYFMYKKKKQKQKKQRYIFRQGTLPLCPIFLVWDL